MDIKTLRADTPGCHHQIHFNNAGAALPPRPVIQTQLRYMLEESITGGYEQAEICRDAIENIYHSIAALIGGQPDEIALTENATHAWHQAFHSIPFKKGDSIITTELEYASNYISYLQKQQEKDVDIHVIPSNDEGVLDVEKLEKAIDSSTRLISISHIPTHTGSVNPAEKIGAIARKYNILYLLDACQSVGQYPIDVANIMCDMLTATGRKYLRGPRGSGFLYVRSGVLEQLQPPFLDLHGAEWVSQDRYRMREDARRFESWESNYGIHLGLGTAAEYALKLQPKNTWQRIKMLAAELREGISGIPGYKVEDRGNKLGGIVTFNHHRKNAGEIKQHLKNKRINISVTTQSSSRIDMTQKGLKEAARASIHYYNTENEILQFLEILDHL